MISPMLPKLCVAVGCPEQGNHCLRLQIKLLICTAHVYFGKVAGTRLLNLILTLDFYELGVLRNRYSYALQGCQQYSLNTTLRPNYCTGWLFYTDFAIEANMVLKISVVADLRHIKIFKIDVKPSIFQNFSAF